MAAVKTRKLSDLYSKGKQLTLDDGEGAVTVWMQKLNPVDSETAIRNANAVRARYLLMHKDKDTPEYLSMLSDVLDYSHDDMVEFMTNQEMTKRAEALEAEVAFDNGWTKDDYLQGLRDAWEGGLKERFFDEEPDEEAVKVHDEMTKFETEFGSRYKAMQADVTAQYDNMQDDSMREQMVEILFRLQCDMAWLQEYRKSELFLGIRDPQHHKQRYFSNRHEVDELEGEILGQLLEGYASLNVPVTEGKDSPETPDSSPESGPQEPQETEQSSGLVAVSP